jgi:hypothetical protein
MSRQPKLSPQELLIHSIDSQAKANRLYLMYYAKTPVETYMYHRLPHLFAVQEAVVETARPPVNNLANIADHPNYNYRLQDDVKVNQPIGVPEVKTEAETANVIANALRAQIEQIHDGFDREAA